MAPNIINLIHYQNKAYQKCLSRKQQEFVHVITIDFSLQSQSNPSHNPRLVHTFLDRLD